eukprot:c2296_g1_i1.p1 GENE.c2296_g1_i1~~c2296_g1_i1.p1  ORF type:complete len:162 (-),score=54.08 c2296_g1_i1:34-519(-)
MCVGVFALVLVCAAVNGSEIDTNLSDRISDSDIDDAVVAVSGRNENVKVSARAESILGDGGSGGDVRDAVSVEKGKELTVNTQSLLERRPSSSTSSSKILVGFLLILAYLTHPLFGWPYDIAREVVFNPIATLPDIIAKVVPLGILLMLLIGLIPMLTVGM